jgi:hypothetical protein
MAKAKTPGTVTSIDSRRKTNNTAKTAKAVEAIREGKAPPPAAAKQAPKPKAGKKGRAVALSRRTVNVTNMNFSPEAAGDKLVERADLSLEVLLEEDDIEDVVHTRGNPLQVLWDKAGEPQLRELGKLALDLKVVGDCKLGLVNGDDEPMEFEKAVLKKVTIEPMIGFKATMYCQVRVDPTGHLEDLAALVIDRKCTFAFKGAGAPEKEDTQGKLDV